MAGDVWPLASITSAQKLMVLPAELGYGVVNVDGVASSGALYPMSLAWL
jgi:hypothetical protein